MTAVPYPYRPFLKEVLKINEVISKRHAVEYDRIVRLHSELLRRNTAKK